MAKTEKDRDIMKITGFLDLIEADVTLIARLLKLEKDYFSCSTQ
jgi:hypothetical protein